MMRSWNIKQKHCFALSWAALLLFVILPVIVPERGWAAEDPVPSCGQGIVQFLKDRLTFQQTRVRTKELIAFQKEYWKEVKESNGTRLITTGKNTLPARYSADLIALCKDAPSGIDCIRNVIKRVLVIDREHPDEIRWKSYLYSPGDWPAAPLAIPFEVLQDRYHLTAPSKFLLSVPVITAATITIDDYLDQKFDEVLKSDVTPGLGYLSELGHQGLLEPGFIGKQLGLDTSRMMTYYTHEHVDKMESWRKSHGRPRHLSRLWKLKEIGLLRTRAEVTKLSQQAFETYQNVTRESEAGVASRFEKAWQERLNQDPEFSGYSVELRHLLGMLFYVPFEISGHSDVELLARSFGLKLKGVESPDPLNALRPLSREVSDVSLVRMAWETLKHPEEALKKQERWTEKFPKEDYPFLHRVDLFSVRAWGDVDFDQEGSSEHQSILKDELSYWELAWKDQRFADIKAAYLKKEVGEFAALKFIHQRVTAYNDLYAASRAAVLPDAKKFCAWMGESGKSAPNILIQGPVSYYMKEIDKREKFSQSEREGCKIDLAEYVYDSYIGALSKRQGTQVLVPLSFPENTVNGVIALCPLQTPPRSCHQSP